MQSGKLDRTIIIERLTETVAPSGAVAASWAAFATVRAELVQQTDTDSQTAQGEGVTGVVTFRIRYLAGVTVADRISYDGQTYAIKDLTELGRRRGLELRAVSS